MDKLCALKYIAVCPVRLDCGHAAQRSWWGGGHRPSRSAASSSLSGGVASSSTAPATRVIAWSSCDHMAWSRTCSFVSMVTLTHPARPSPASACKGLPFQAIVGGSGGSNAAGSGAQGEAGRKLWGAGASADAEPENQLSRWVRDHPALRQLMIRNSRPCQQYHGICKIPAPTPTPSLWCV